MDKDPPIIIADIPRSCNLRPSLIVEVQRHARAQDAVFAELERVIRIGWRDHPIYRGQKRLKSNFLGSERLDKLLLGIGNLLLRLSPDKY